jgi:hypothetical protein
MDALNPSETSVRFHPTTRRNIPEDSYVHGFLVTSFYVIFTNETCVTWAAMSKLTCRVMHRFCSDLSLYMELHALVLKGTPSIITISYITPISNRMIQWRQMTWVVKTCHFLIADYSFLTQHDRRDQQLSRGDRRYRVTLNSRQSSQIASLLKCRRMKCSVTAVHERLL